MSFAKGFDVGQRAAAFGLARADEQRQQDRQNQRQDKLDQDTLLNRALDRKRMDRIEQQFEVEQQEKKAETARYVEASTAYDKFAAAAGILDPGNPAALDQYAAVTKQYLPAILKHEGVAKKWESMDRVFKQGQAFTVRKLADTATLKAMEEAARLAPEVMLNPPKLPDGTPDFASIRTIIDERRQQMEEHAVNLRRASVDARAEAEAAGAYGGRTAGKATMGPGTKAEMDAVADELREVNKRLVAMGGAPLVTGDDSTVADKKRDLLNRKSTLQRRLRSFDDMVQQPTRTPPAPPRTTGEGGQPAAEPVMSPEPQPEPTAPTGPSPADVRPPAWYEAFHRGQAVKFRDWTLQVIDPGASTRARRGPTGERRDVQRAATDAPAPRPQAEVPTSAEDRTSPPESKPEDIVQFVKKATGYFDKPSAETLFGKPALVGRREWDWKSAVEWVNREAKRLRKTISEAPNGRGQPRDVERLAQLERVLDGALSRGQNK